MKQWREPTCRASLSLLLGIALLSGCATADPDPFESANRRIFRFNEGADRWVVEPIATGWDVVAPGFIQTGVRNFFDNLRMPVVLANDLLQLKPRAVFDDIARLIFNSTFGLGGLLDVATREGVPHHDEDFGQTLGFWGIPAGPYLELPIFGPSTARDVAGLAVDSLGTVPSYFVPIWVSSAGQTVRLVNLRAEFLDEIRESRRESLDYYAFRRNAYLQNRKKKVDDLEALSDETEEDLYYFDEAEGDDEDIE